MQLALSFHLRSGLEGSRVALRPAVFTGLNSLPPVLIADVPVNGAAHALFKRDFIPPAEFALDFRRIGRVAAVVAEPVLDPGDQLLRAFLARQAEPRVN